jgi:hypothetical protein
MLQQHGHDSKRLLGQANGLAVVRAQFTGAKVKFEGVENGQKLWRC